MAKENLNEQNPKNNWLKRSNSLLIGCLVILVLFVIAGIIGARSSTTSKNQQTKTQEESKQEVQKSSERSEYIFDIPSLVGKNIDEIKIILGNPIDGNMTEPNQDQLTLGVEEWDNTFKKDNEELLVTFHPQTRKVIDFFLETSPEQQDENRLLKIGNLKENSQDYKLEFVKELKDPTKITGVKIIPK